MNRAILILYLFLAVLLVSYVGAFIYMDDCGETETTTDIQSISDSLLLFRYDFGPRTTVIRYPVKDVELEVFLVNDTLTIRIIEK